MAQVQQVKLYLMISGGGGVLAFADNDVNKQGKQMEGLPVISPCELNKYDYDAIIIASHPGLEPLYNQLISLGVDENKIITDYVYVSQKARIIFFEKYAQLQSNIKGSVAEGGVFQGECAKEINRVFPNKKIYLFDTFSGFDKRDVDVDEQRGLTAKGISGFGHLNITDENLVLSKLPFPKMCEIRKGYFPETAEGINDTFCFVNLDFDLYQPTKAALEFFVPKMEKGGVILIHDYFHKGNYGIKEAIDDYMKENGRLNLFPIGDGISIGILF